MVKCVAVWCNVLQCNAGFVIVSYDEVCEVQCVATWCSVLQCVATWCSVLQCVATWCSVLQRGAVCCNVLQCVATCCSVLQQFAATVMNCQKSPMNSQKKYINKRLAALHVRREDFDTATTVTQCNTL